MKKSVIICLAIFAVALTGTQAFAISLGMAGDYNAFIFGDFTATGSNTQGRLAAGGNVSLSGHGVGGGLPYDGSGTTNTLVAGGNLTMGNWGNIKNGNAVVGGTADLPNNYSPSNGTLSENTTGIINWAAQETYLLGLSRDLSTMTTTGTADYESWTNPRGTMSFAGDGTSAVQVFDVAGSFWSTTHTFTFENNTTNAPENAAFIFNISGTSVSMQNAGMWTFLSVLKESYDNVIFNFYEATALTISGIDVQGSILAPLADISATGGNINGTVIARSFTGSAGTGLNNRPFESFTDPGTEAPTPVPEPGTLVVFSCGLLFFSALMRRRKYL